MHNDLDGCRRDFDRLFAIGEIALVFARAQLAFDHQVSALFELRRVFRESAVYNATVPLRTGLILASGVLPALVGRQREISDGFAGLRVASLSVASGESDERDAIEIHKSCPLTFL